jgi:predicted xylose isomerase-like sugar epimerase
MIQRAIEQFAAALAKVLGLSGAAQHAEALEAVREAKGALPIVPGMLEDMDVQGLIESLGVEQARLLARLWAAEADLHDRMGRPLLAERPRRRSHELFAQLDRPPPSATGEPPPR